MEAYKQEFYAGRHEKTVYSADTILSILLERIPAIDSAVDIGCGVGTWLSVLRNKGVKDIQGVDGHWVDQELLAIPRACFSQVDLGKSEIRLPRRYDLAISLEVAEHLPSDRAAEFVSSLAALSDYVLFSAAIPLQGGTNHVNEQWQHYWVKLFGDIGYVVHDCIRPRIWDDTRIPFWYRQNILFFSRRQKSRGGQLDTCGHATWSMPLDVVHPDLYLVTANARAGVKISFGLLRRSMKDYIRNRFHRGS